MHVKICLLVDSSTGKMDVFYRKATGICFGFKKKVFPNRTIIYYGVRYTFIGETHAFNINKYSNDVILPAGKKTSPFYLIHFDCYQLKDFKL